LKPSAKAKFSLAKRFSWITAREQFVKLGLMLCAVMSLATTVAIVYVLVTEAVRFFREVSPIEFAFGTEWSPQFDPPAFGVLPLIGGTILIAVIGALIGLPIGLLAAIYLSEYAKPKMRQIVKPLLEILAGIPSVVYGYFALVFVTPYVLRPIFQEMLGVKVGIFNALSAAMVVGVMIIPTVCSLSEDALRAVPRGLREAGYALGSTKFDVSLRVVVPAAFSGIVASFLLAVSRAIGETMAVAIAAGETPVFGVNVLNKMATMTAYIVNIVGGDVDTGSIEYKSLYAVAITLFAITLGMNILAQWVMRRYREVYE
jgi:phosphate transport system permease protein